ncbi:MAG: heparinase II/III family protein [Bacteroides sp.]|nr:heparinase II/III family protein [Bacteroides sp.]
MIVIVLFLLLLNTGGLRIIVDFVIIGIDYISLKGNPAKISDNDIKDAVKSSDRSGIFVLASQQAFDNVKCEIEADDGDCIVKAYFDYVSQCADDLLSREPLPYLIEDDRLLETSRQILERIAILSYIYRITGQVRYAQRAVIEMKNACSYNDWHDSHFLDCAELSFAIALGTNWLYDYIDEESRLLFANKCYEYALKRGKGKPFKNWWRWSKTNWNSVCHSALAITSLVFYDDYPDTAVYYLKNAYKKLPYAFESFAPNGVYSEGVGYWAYGTGYLTYFLSTSNNLFGMDFGLSDMKGMSSLGMFPIYLSGSCGPFNYGDNKKVSATSPSLYWLAQKYDNPIMAYYESLTSAESEMQMGKGLYEVGKEFCIGSLWYDADIVSRTSLENIEKSILLKSDVGEDVAIIRQSYFDRNATYFATKGGYNYTNHGDLDIGNFVFDSRGVRWAEDLGPDYYSKQDYFVGLIGGGRWKNYIKRAEGQNTLVINPSKVHEDQYPFAKVSISSFNKTSDGGIVSLDMTDAYCFCGVYKAIRTFEVFDNYSSLKISDSIDCANNSLIYWFMHTSADIEIVDAHTAILTSGDKKMLAKLGDDSIGSFQKMEMQSVVDGIDNTSRADADIKKLTVKAERTNGGKIEVTLTPL